MPIRRHIFRFATLVAVALAAACGREQAPTAPLPPPVRVVKASAASPVERVVATGLVRAAVEAPLAFKTAGILAEVRVDAGQSVKAGQVLAQLVSSDVDAAMAQARESLAKYERDLARAVSLRAKGMISQQAEQDVRAQRDIAKAALNAADVNRQLARMTAPSDGVILEKRAEARETVAAGQPVVVFGQLERGWVVRAGVAARDALRLTVGDAVVVRLDVDGRELNARLARIAAASDARTGTVEIEVALPREAGRLVSGMVAHLTVSKSPAHATPNLRVPLSAVLEGNGGSARLFVLEGAAAGGDGESASGKVRRIEVRTGRLRDGEIEILDGLSADALVVSEGAAWLDDGAVVRVLR